jgi:hypothetical protein
MAAIMNGSHFLGGFGNEIIMNESSEMQPNLIELESIL